MIQPSPPARKGRWDATFLHIRFRALSRADTVALRALNLTQEEFAARFRLPLGTVLDWEQGGRRRVKRPKCLRPSWQETRTPWRAHPPIVDEELLGSGSTKPAQSSRRREDGANAPIVRNFARGKHLRERRSTASRVWSQASDICPGPNKRYQSRAVLGDAIDGAYQTFHGALVKIQVSAKTLSGMAGRGRMAFEKNEDLVRQCESAIWQEMPGEDPIQPLVERAIEVGEACCRPILERTWGGQSRADAQFSLIGPK